MRRYTEIFSNNQILHLQTITNAVIGTRSHDDYHVIVPTFHDIFLLVIQGVPFFFYVPKMLPPNNVLKSFLTVKAHEILRNSYSIFMREFLLGISGYIDMFFKSLL